jgi:hypothetical protein
MALNVVVQIVGDVVDVILLYALKLDVKFTLATL